MKLQDDAMRGATPRQAPMQRQRKGREPEKFLAKCGSEQHISDIEFRPKDLASPAIARQTDDILPKISTKRLRQ